MFSTLNRLFVNQRFLKLSLENLIPGLSRFFSSLSFYIITLIMSRFVGLEIAAISVVFFTVFTFSANIAYNWLEQSLLRFQEVNKLGDLIFISIPSALFSSILLVAVDKSHDFSIFIYLMIVLVFLSEFFHRLTLANEIIKNNQKAYSFYTLRRGAVEILLGCLAIPFMNKTNIIFIICLILAVSRLQAINYYIVVFKRSIPVLPWRWVKYGVPISLFLGLSQGITVYAQQFVTIHLGSLSNGIVLYQRYLFQACVTVGGIFLISLTPKIFSNSIKGLKVDYLLRYNYYYSVVVIIFNFIVLIIAIFVNIRLSLKITPALIYLVVASTTAWSLAQMSVKPLEINNKVFFTVIYFAIAIFISIVITYFKINDYRKVLVLFNIPSILYYFMISVHCMKYKFQFRRSCSIHLLLSSTLIVVGIYALL